MASSEPIFSSKVQERVWEVDFLRGVAVLMMLVSNFVFDLTVFADFQISNSLFWPWLARSTAALFLLVVGISLRLSCEKPAARQVGFSKVLSRGSKIFGLGLFVSLVTWRAVGENLVVFGILHLIGFGVMLAYPFLSHKYLSLVTGIFVIVGGWGIQKVVVSWPWLVWLGLQYQGFSSVDYTPLFPWFGFILLGIFLGGSFFPAGKRLFQPPEVEDVLPVRTTRWLGCHSLWIYFIHQPIFWAGFLLWKGYGG